MNRILSILALMASTAANAGVIYTHDSDGETVDLYAEQDGCPAKTLRVTYTLADRKTVHRGCWVPMGDKVAIQWDDGDRGLLPIAVFRKAVSL